MRSTLTTLTKHTMGRLRRRTSTKQRSITLVVRSLRHRCRGKAKNDSSSGKSCPSRFLGLHPGFVPPKFVLIRTRFWQQLLLGGRLARFPICRDALFLSHSAYSAQAAVRLTPASRPVVSSVANPSSAAAKSISTHNAIHGLSSLTVD
jgi:hypothetical protein